MFPIRKARTSADHAARADQKVMFKEVESHATQTLSRSSRIERPIATDNKFEYDVFYAHDWGIGGSNHKKVASIAKRLEAAEFKGWLDEKELRGKQIDLDVLIGLKKSACVIVFITENYLARSNSKETNSGKEFRQAVSLGVDYIIPVAFDPVAANPKNWALTIVGYHLGNPLFIDFSTPEKIEANFDELCAVVRDKIALGQKENKKAFHEEKLKEIEKKARKASS